MRVCQQCGQPTKNPKFCSRSCSAIHNNHTTPKRSRKRRCAGVGCTTLILQDRKHCAECTPKRKWGTDVRTLGDVTGSARYQVHAQVRTHARGVMRRSGQAPRCRVCGYSAHVEVSHIRAISTFPSTALISEVNGLDNLEYLCPNHHWEHENGLL